MSYIPNSSNPIKTIQEIITDEQGKQEKKDVFVYTSADGVVLDDGSVVSEALKELKRDKADKTIKINGNTLAADIDLDYNSVGAAPADHEHTAEDVGADTKGSAAAVQENLDALSEIVTEIKNRTNTQPLYVSTSDTNPTKLVLSNGQYEVMNNGYVLLDGLSSVSKGAIVIFNDNSLLLIDNPVISLYSYDSQTEEFKNTDRYAKLSDVSESEDVLNEKINKCIPTSKMAVANGVATLNENGTIPSSQLPSYVDDVIEYDNFNSFPETGESGKIYLDISTNITYRWSGSNYVEIGNSLALGETDSTAFPGDRGKKLENIIDSELHSCAFDGNAETVNGKTVNSDVPADAIFDETTKRLTIPSDEICDISNLEDGCYQLNNDFGKITVSGLGSYLTLYRGSIIIVRMETGNIFIIGAKNLYRYKLKDEVWSIYQYIDQSNFYAMLKTYIGTTYTTESNTFSPSSINIGCTYVTLDSVTIHFGSEQISVQNGGLIFKRSYLNNYYYYIFSGCGCYRIKSTDMNETSFEINHFVTDDEIIAPVDNLSSTSTVSPLSANQGRILDETISTGITGLNSSIVSANAEIENIKTQFSKSTELKTLDLSDSIANYFQGNCVNTDTPLIAYKYGRTVTLTGEIGPSDEFTRDPNVYDSLSRYLITTLPEGFRPIKHIYQLCHGHEESYTLNYHWLLTIDPSGNVYFSHFSAETGKQEAYSGQTWLPLSVTYISDK